MTSEADFVTVLDAEPGNHWLRQVYADWLEDQGDERAAGMRMLAQMERVPHCFDTFWSYHNGDGICRKPPTLPENSLPQVWLDKMDRQSSFWSVDEHSRAAAEDAAALAYLRLTDAERAKIMAGVKV